MPEWERFYPTFLDAVEMGLGAFFLSFFTAALMIPMLLCVAEAGLTHRG